MTRSFYASSLPASYAYCAITFASISCVCEVQVIALRWRGRRSPSESRLVKSLQCTPWITAIHKKYRWCAHMERQAIIRWIRPSPKDAISQATSLQCSDGETLDSAMRERKSAGRECEGGWRGATPRCPQECAKCIQRMGLQHHYRFRWKCTAFQNQLRRHIQIPYSHHGVTNSSWTQFNDMKARERGTRQNAKCNQCLGLQH